MEITKQIYKKIKNPFVDFCVKHEITANQITFLNHFLMLTFGVYFFSRGTYFNNLSGLLICIITGFLDFLDGDIAKATNTYSLFGEWIDSGFDVIIQNVIMAAIAMGCYKIRLPLFIIIPLVCSLFLTYILIILFPIRL